MSYPDLSDSQGYLNSFNLDKSVTKLLLETGNPAEGAGYLFTAQKWSKLLNSNAVVKSCTVG